MTCHKTYAATNANWMMPTIIMIISMKKKGKGNGEGEKGEKKGRVFWGTIMRKKKGMQRKQRRGISLRTLSSTYMHMGCKKVYCDAIID